MDGLHRNYLEYALTAVIAAAVGVLGTLGYMAALGTPQEQRLEQTVAEQTAELETTVVELREAKADLELRIEVAEDANARRAATYETVTLPFTRDEVVELVKRVDDTLSVAEETDSVLIMRGCEGHFAVAIYGRDRVSHINTSARGDGPYATEALVNTIFVGEVITNERQFGEWLQGALDIADDYEFHQPLGGFLTVEVVVNRFDNGILSVQYRRPPPRNFAFE